MSKQNSKLYPYNHQKSKQNLRPRNLIFLSWGFFFIGSLNFALRSSEQVLDSPLSLEVIHRPISLTLFMGVFVIYFLWQPIIVPKGILSIFFLFAVWRLISVFWSYYGLWTLYKSIEYLSVILLLFITVLYLDNIYTISKWFFFVLKWFGILLASAYIGILVFPEQALRPFSNASLPFALTGVLPRINNTALGEIGAIFAIIGIIQFYNTKKQSYIMLVIVGLITLFLAQGRAAIFGFLISFLLVIIVLKKFKLLWLLLFFVLLGLLFVGDQINIIREYFLRGQTPEMFMGFSTRFQWWTVSWRYLIRNKILIGYGAFAGGRIYAPILLNNVETRITMDNTWFELILDTGIIGMLLFLLPTVWAYFVLMRRAFSKDRETKYFSLTLLGVITILLTRSLFVSSISLHQAFLFLACIGGAEFLRTRRFVREG